MQYFQNPDEERDSTFPARPFAVIFLLCFLFWALAIYTCKAQSVPQKNDWYGWTKQDLNKLGAWSLCAVGGVAWGTHEALYADPHVLEKRFGFSPRSWGGHLAWESKYPGGDYQEGERPVWFRDKTNLFREAKKTTAFAGRYLPVTAGIVLTRQKNRKWSDYLIGVLVYTGSATLTYNLLR